MKDIKINSIEELTEDYIVFITDKEESYKISGGDFVKFEKEFEDHLLGCCDGCVVTKKHILDIGLEEFNKGQDLTENLNQFITDSPNFVSEYGITKLN